MDMFEKQNKFSQSQGTGSSDSKIQFNQNDSVKFHKSDFQVFNMDESTIQSQNQKQYGRNIPHKTRDYNEKEDFKQDDNTDEEEIKECVNQNINEYNLQKKHKNKNSRKNQQILPQQFLNDDAFLVDDTAQDVNQEQSIDEMNENLMNYERIKKEEEEFNNRNNKIKIKNSQTMEQQFEDELSKFSDNNFDDNQQSYSNEQRIVDNRQYSINFFENLDNALDNTEQCVYDEFENDGNDELINISYQNNQNFNLQQGGTFFNQGFFKTTIIDHHFNGDNQFVKEKLNDTILQVHSYVQNQIEERQKQIKEFEKKLKKFIFDYRYDQNHHPRKYAQNYSKLTEQNMKQKFQDPKYDQRKIQYEIQDIDKNPFSLFCNEVDVYVHTLSNENIFQIKMKICIKQAYYNELELYLKAVFQEKCDIYSNYYSERRIYHQCINFTFKETRLTLKIRVQLQKSNLFQARDKIVNSFYEKNVQEIKIFAGFVLYWAQKRKILSAQVLDKNAWTNLILYFFQINGRLPPTLNYDMLSIKADDIELKCYQIAEEYHNQQKKQQKNKDFNNQDQKSKMNEYQMIPERAFDFKLFESENINQQFIIQLKPPQNVNYRNKEFTKIYKVLPIIRPNPSEKLKVKEIHNFNYGFFFYKFLYFLNFQLVIDPIAISLSGRIIFKRKNSNNQTQEPIAIYDSIWTDINLVSHLSYSQDAFNHFMEQIQFAYQTIYGNKNQKTFLTDIQAPAFSMIKKSKTPTNQN